MKSLYCHKRRKKGRGEEGITAASWHLRSDYGKEVNGSYPLSRWVRTQTWLKKNHRAPRLGVLSRSRPFFAIPFVTKT